MATVDIRTLLERLGIEATQRNDRWWAPCPHPEHDEKTGSWFIEDCPGDDTEHGHHFCFGCKRGGWPIQLVDAVLGLERKEAWKWLAGTAQHAPARLRVEMVFRPTNRRFVLPKGVVQKPLDEWPPHPRRYANLRKLSVDEVHAWRIGYAMSGRLRGRIVLPVYNATGKLLSYTGRTFDKNHIKYLEPGKEEGANLGAVFGEMLWPIERDYVVVTEGALDGLAVWRETGLPVGGLYGSQLHPGQLARLSSFKRVIIATDNDTAGNHAFEELKGQLARHCQIARAAIPSGQDCASLGIGLRAVIESAEWLTDAPPSV